MAVSKELEGGGVQTEPLLGVRYIPLTTPEKQLAGRWLRTALHCTTQHAIYTLVCCLSVSVIFFAVCAHGGTRNNDNILDEWWAFVRM